MKLVVGTEAMFFLSLIVAFVYMAVSGALSHMTYSSLI